MPEGLSKPAEFFNSEPQDEVSKPETTQVKVVTEPIQYDSEKGEIIILAQEGKEEKRHPFQEVLYKLRDEGVPASTGEWLDLQTLLDAGEVQGLDELYIVARAVLVKDVTHYPKFDNVFGEMFYGLEPPDPDEENEYDEYYEDEYEDGDDSTEYDQEESDAQQKEGEEKDEEDSSKQDGEDKEKKETEDTVQKEKEDIEEVVEATSLTSEEVHGGKEATKDIEDSPSPADEGKDKDNKGAEKGIEGTEGGGDEGEGGDNKSQKAEKGEGGDTQSGMGSEGKDDLEESEEAVKGKKKKSKSKGKRKKKPRIQKQSTGGEGGYGSAKERILERKYDELGEDRSLSYEHFGRALSKLRGIIQETTNVRTRTLDAKATVQSISEHGGAPELLWKEEVEEKPNVVLMFDVGGSTDEFRPILEQLFTAAKDELQGLEIYYFHNAIYGEVWPQKDGNYGKNFVPMGEIMKRDPSTKVIVVGDAWMADSDWMNGGLHDSYEELHERSDADNRYHRMSGHENFRAIVDNFPSTVWINPILEKDHEEWDNSGTIEDVKQLLPMHDLTLEGLETAVKKLMEDL